VQSAQNTGLNGLDGIVLVMNRRSGTRQIVDSVGLDPDRVGDVVADQFKSGVSQQMLDVLFAPGEKIVQAKNLFLFFQQSLAQVRPDKTRTARYKIHYRHVFPILLSLSLWLWNRFSIKRFHLSGSAGLELETRRPPPRTNSARQYRHLAPFVTSSISSRFFQHGQQSHANWQVKVAQQTSFSLNGPLQKPIGPLGQFNHMRLGALGFSKQTVIELLKKPKRHNGRECKTDAVGQSLDPKPCRNKFPSQFLPCITPTVKQGVVVVAPEKWMRRGGENKLSAWPQNPVDFREHAVVVFHMLGEVESRNHIARVVAHGKRLHIGLQQAVQTALTREIEGQFREIQSGRPTPGIQVTSMSPVPHPRSRTRPPSDAWQKAFQLIGDKTQTALKPQ
jgi:hypothetical protein